MPHEANLLRAGYELRLLGGDEEANARTLAERGLVILSERETVRCDNPTDPDYRAATRGCLGVVQITAGRDDGDGEYRCPDCDRELRPSEKARSGRVSVTPVPQAIVDFVATEMRAVGLEPREMPKGLLRAASDRGDVQVCVVDFCTDGAVLDAGYVRTTPIAYVVANTTCAAHVPPGATVFSVTDLALGGTQAFRRVVREMARATAAPPLPAVFGRRATKSAPPAIATPLTAAAPKFAMPLGTRWENISFDWIEDDDRVRVSAPGLAAPIRCSAADLGWGNAKQRWQILKRVCAGRGFVREWRALAAGHVAKDDEHRGFDAVKKQVSRMRDDLQALFGLAEDPFKFCSRQEGLRARFEANECLPETRPWAGLKVPDAERPVRIGQPVSDARSIRKSTESVRGARVAP